MCLLKVEGQNTFCYNTCNILYRSLSLMGMWETSPPRKGIWNPGKFCLWNPGDTTQEIWNPTNAYFDFPTLIAHSQVFSPFKGDR